MTEYIEREALKRKLLRRKYKGKNLDGHELSFNDGITEAVYALDKIPAADVRPERYGVWMGTVCTACGESTCDYYNCNYCPWCGAKMDGEEDDENDIGTENKRAATSTKPVSKGIGNIERSE